MTLELDDSGSKKKSKKKSRRKRELEEDPGNNVDAIKIRHIKEKSFAELRREKEKKMKIFKKFLHKRGKEGKLGGNVLNEFQGVLYEKIKNKNLRRENKIRKLRADFEKVRCV